MFKPLRISTVALLVLTSCASQTSHPDPDRSLTWSTYTCVDGRAVQAAYPDTTTALVKFDGRTHTLHVAMSGSGARYTGDGWQWWTKGMHDGLLAPLAAGETIARAPGVACHAP